MVPEHLLLLSNGLLPPGTAQTRFPLLKSLKHFSGRIFQILPAHRHFRRLLRRSGGPSRCTSTLKQPMLLEMARSCHGRLHSYKNRLHGPRLQLPTLVFRPSARNSLRSRGNRLPAHSYRSRQAHIPRRRERQCQYQCLREPVASPAQTGWIIPPPSPHFLPRLNRQPQGLPALSDPTLTISCHALRANPPSGDRYHLRHR